jgi:hypothetical protein
VFVESARRQNPERRDVAQRDEGRNPRDDLGFGEQRRMALIRHFDHVDVEPARAHRIDRRRRENVRIDAAHHHQRNARERIECAPQGRGRTLGVDRFERRRDLRIVVENEPLAGLRPGAPGLCEPLLGRHRGELRVAEPAQYFGAVGEAARRRHLADIALDADQALGVDHRTDIVEDHAGERAGPRGAEQHRENAAARGAEHDGPPDVERGEDRKDVGELYGKRIVIRFGSWPERPRPRESMVKTRRGSAASLPNARASSWKSEPLRVRPAGRRSGADARPPFHSGAHAAAGRPAR